MAINPLDAALTQGINPQSQLSDVVEEGMDGRPLAPASSDVDFFKQQLDGPLSPQESAATPSVSGTGKGNAITAMLDSFNDSSKEAEASLQKASLGTTPAQIVDSMRKVSSFDLQSRLLAKMVGDGVKGIDKLTNMQ
ncbi:hypothetical protein LMG33818_002207 [Halomonadaceae bacterium LMG 33818]|uniref:EscI/YscI/HrpB family type III secretion system inner rod protein n=1 Tax=Cernens ardua TaxID=3402176 RepID=UPI003EDBE61B